MWKIYKRKIVEALAVRLLLGFATTERSVNLICAPNNSSYILTTPQIKILKLGFQGWVAAFVSGTFVYFRTF